MTVENTPDSQQHREEAAGASATDEQHRKMAERRKEGFERKKAKAAGEKGLLIVHTGTGKGKTSAALGMVVRSLAHNLGVGVVQFIKGAMETGERTFFADMPGIEFHAIGDGFTWDTQDRSADIATARRAWDQACKLIADPKLGLVVLDELNVILKYEYISLDEVIKALRSRRPDQHVVVTGRHAPEALIAEADLVTEMRAIRHPFREQGIRAQRGIEF